MRGKDPKSKSRLPSGETHPTPLVLSSFSKLSHLPREKKHPRARNDYDEEAAYESYMNPEPGFQSGPGDSVDAD